MTEKTSLMENLQWQDICEGKCYSPQTHSHNFTLDKNTEVLCEKCNQKTHLDAQVYGTEFGKNKALLSNVYQCKCGCTLIAHLYNGPQMSLKDIYLHALSNLQAGTYKINMLNN